MKESLWSEFKKLTICQLVLAIIYITTGLIVNLVQLLMYLTIRPFNARLYRKLNFYVTYIFNSQVVFLVEWWSGTDPVIFTDHEFFQKYYGKEHAILLLNHGYEIDWLVGWVVCDRVGVLGNAKVYVKKMLKFAPVLGWSWIFQEIVFLERNWEKDKQTLGPQLRRFLEYPDPVWVTLFPEGTRFTPEKHKASMEVARQKGLSELKHHLLPRTRGFVSSVPHLKPKFAAIYDVVVAFKKNELPTVSSLLRGEKAHPYLCMRRIPIEEVPDDEEKAGAWMHDLFRKKDKLLDNFLNTGEFTQERSGEFKNFKFGTIPRRPYSLINITIWATIWLGLLFWCLAKVLASASFTKVCIIFSFVCFAYAGLNRLVNLSKISRASEYGNQDVTQNGNHVLHNPNLTNCKKLE